MAELLVKAISVDHADPAKSQRCYKRGDVVVVMEDGHTWGREEGPPKFYRVSVPGPAADYRYLTQDVRDRDGRMVKRRALTIKSLRSGSVSRADLVSATESR